MHYARNPTWEKNPIYTIEFKNPATGTGASHHPKTLSILSVQLGLPVKRRAQADSAIERQAAQAQSNCLRWGVELDVVLVFPTLRYWATGRFFMTAPAGTIPCSR